MSSDNLVHEYLAFVYKLRKLSRNKALHENPAVSFANCASGTSPLSGFQVIFLREGRAGRV